MARYDIVIPTKTRGNILACLNNLSTRETRFEGLIFVVHHELDTIELTERLPAWTLRYSSIVPSPIRLIDAPVPFVFAKSVNTAIRLSSADVLIVMNDDALLMTEGGLTSLAEECEKAIEFGVISAGICGAACNAKVLVPQRPFTKAPVQVQDAGKMVPFICVAFRRSVWNRVGGLDEQFIDYGFEDDDFCRSCRKHCWKIGVLKSTVVDHGHLPSTFRSAGHAVSLEPNRLRYIAKWGDHEGA